MKDNEFKEEKPKHNMDWIEKNHRYAIKFAKQYDPLKIKEVADLYNPKIHNMLEIYPSDTNIAFTVRFAWEGDKTNESYPLGYEVEPALFPGQMEKCYTYFKKKVEWSPEIFNAYQRNIENGPNSLF